MESSNPNERAAYRKAAPLDTGEDTSNMTTEPTINSVVVEDGDFSWLVSVLAVLTMQGDLWIHPTILYAAKNGGYLAREDYERARRLLDAFKPHAKTNAELGQKPERVRLIADCYGGLSAGDEGTVVARPDGETVVKFDRDGSERYIIESNLETI